MEHHLVVSVSASCSGRWVVVLAEGEKEGEREEQSLVAKVSEESVKGRREREKGREDRK